MSDAPGRCTCEALESEDALVTPWLEVVGVIHNACAPVNYYTCRCKTCGTRWLALEVYDEDGTRQSEWSWEREAPAST